MLLYTRFGRESLEGFPVRYIGSGFLSRVMMLLYKDDYRYVRSNELKVKKEVKSIFFSTEKELNKSRKLIIVQYSRIDIKNETSSGY